MDRISKEIQELIKNYKDPDLTLSISNPETKNFTIAVCKKSRIWPTKNKTNLFQHNYKKNKDFLVYGYYEHWEHKTLCIKYGIRISNSDSKKIKKQLTMKTDTRHKLNVGSTRIWNMTNNWPENKPVGFRYSYLIDYLGDTRILESLIGVIGLVFNFQSISVAEKNGYLRRYWNIKLKNRIHGPLEDVFYSPFDKG